MIFLVIRLPEKRGIVLDVEKEYSWQSTKIGIPVANADLQNLNKSQNNFRLVPKFKSNRFILILESRPRSLCSLCQNSHNYILYVLNQISKEMRYLYHL